MAAEYLETAGPVRPTRHRLAVTTTVSACLVAALLALVGSVADIARQASGPVIEGKERLTVVVRDGENKSKTPDSQLERTSPPVVKQELTVADDRTRQQEPVIDDPPAPPADVEPAIDWHAMKKEIAGSGVAELFEEHEYRVAMWRRSHSIMVRPSDDFDIGEDEPFIPDFRFRPQIHVVGLGFTIGSCFVGIPLAGVPVEQRSAAITLFVCARDAG